MGAPLPAGRIPSTRYSEATPLGPLSCEEAGVSPDVVLELKSGGGGFGEVQVISGAATYNWETFATESWSLANIVCAFAIVARKGVVEGKSVSGRVDPVDGRVIKK